MEGKVKFRAIVVGCSAGGLKVLSEILNRLPAAYSLPIVIVQHRSKDQKNLLEEILQSKSEIKVKQADEKEALQGGVIYFAPPDYHLLVEEDETLSLSVDDHVKYSRPSIDVLFESAASVYKEKLIGIILTGANNDGQAGIKAIARNGGLTIAQLPEQAEYPYMPRAAVETKKVKYIWTIGQIVDFLLKIDDTI